MTYRCIEVPCIFTQSNCNTCNHSMHSSTPCYCTNNSQTDKGKNRQADRQANRQTKSQSGPQLQANMTITAMSSVHNCMFETYVWTLPTTTTTPVLSLPCTACVVKSMHVGPERSIRAIYPQLDCQPKPYVTQLTWPNHAAWRKI